MGFKDWPSWLKGGVILGIVYIILLFMFYLYGLLLNYWDKVGTVPIIAQIPMFIGLLLIFLPIALVNSIIPIAMSPGSFFSKITLIGYVGGFVFYFIIGALIGFIIGKLKSKNQNQQINPNNRVTKG